MNHLPSRQFTRNVNLFSLGKKIRMWSATNFAWCLKCQIAIMYSTSIAMVISFAIHDKKFYLLVQNKCRMSMGLAWVKPEGMEREVS